MILSQPFLIRITSFGEIALSFIEELMEHNHNHNHIVFCGGKYETNSDRNS